MRNSHLNNFLRIVYNTHNGSRPQPSCRNRQPRYPGARDPVAQRYRRGFLLRRRHVLDGPRPLGHQPGHQGAQERWYPVHPHRDPHHPPLDRRLHDRVSCVHPRVQARSARLRDYPLIDLGLPFMSIIRTNPKTNIATMYVYSFFHS